MNLRYKRYKYSENKEDIKRIYEESFPVCERFPFWVLKCCSNELNVYLDCILSDDVPVGMQFIVEYDDISYLMYFAIDKKFRNLGYGSHALKNLVIAKDNVLLCIERPNITDDLKHRRKNFYLRNGFYETKCCIEDTGVEYEFLSSEKGYKPTVHELRGRYSYMTTNPLIKLVIHNTFDTDFIKFID